MKTSTDKINPNENPHDHQHNNLLYFIIVLIHLIIPFDSDMIHNLMQTSDTIQKSRQVGL